MSKLKFGAGEWGGHPFRMQRKQSHRGAQGREGEGGEVAEAPALSRMTFRPSSPTLKTLC